MRHPLISVLIPSYNHEKFLREAIESVWSQTYKNIEIIVVDDCSVDASAALLSSLRAQSPVAMRVVFNEYNRGPAFTIGRAFELSRGELVAFLASDDVYAPSRFEAQLRRFEGNPDLLLSFGEALALNADNTYEARVHGKRVKKLLLKPPREVLAFLYTHVSPLHIQCALVKRTLLLESNAFDPSALADDWLINIKMFEVLAQRGSCAFVDQVVCYYRIHEKNLHKNTDRQIAVMQQTIERYTPAALRRLARANIYWNIGLLKARTNPRESLKYFSLSQRNHFRPWLIIDLPVRILRALFKYLREYLRTRIVSSRSQ